jgi:PST family polysaccharide transporter
MSKNNLSLHSVDASARGRCEVSELKNKSVGGGFITVLFQGAAVAIQLLSTVILARILAPEDYGTLAMVTAVTAFAALFRDLGLSSAAIQKNDLTVEQQSNLFWINVSMGVFLTVVVAALAPVIARFYQRPELVNVTLALSLSFVITSISAQHAAMLVRGMEFSRSSGARILGAVATLGVSVLFALRGYSYWSLVWGILVGAAVTSICLMVFFPFCPRPPSRRSGVRELLGFGVNVTAFNFVNYFSRNLDNILIGRFCGVSDLGIYNRAYQLLMFPIVNLRGPIESVAFPAMSRLDSKSCEFRSYYCDLISLLAMITMPLMAWMFISADEIIQVLLGPEWGGVSPVFSILSLVGFVQPVSSLRGLIMLCSGQSKRYFKGGLISSAAVSVAFLIGVCWGVLGVAWSYVIVVWILVYPMHIYSIKGTSIKKLDLVRSCIVPAAGAIGSIIIIIFTRFMWAGASKVFIIALNGFVILIMCCFLYCVLKSSRRLFIGTFERFLCYIHKWF